MITFEDVCCANRVICEFHGQTSLIINKNNILSALGVQQWYTSDCLLAAALIRSLIIAHGFQDGNKRTATSIGSSILPFECSQDDSFDCIIRIAMGQLKDVDEIASILYPRSYNNIIGE